MKHIYGTTVARKRARVGKEDKVSEETMWVPFSNLFVPITN